MVGCRVCLGPVSEHEQVAEAQLRVPLHLLEGPLWSISPNVFLA
jgi:hypothetical protein